MLKIKIIKIKASEYKIKKLNSFHDYLKKNNEDLTKLVIDLLFKEEKRRREEGLIDA